MSKKNKLQKFEENKSFDNLFQYSYERIMAEGFPLQGRWRTDFFHNDNPIVLELGCGKGEYTVGLARIATSTISVSTSRAPACGVA